MFIKRATQIRGPPRRRGALTVASAHNRTGALITELLQKLPRGAQAEPRRQHSLGMGQRAAQCCSTAGRAAGALCRAAISAILAASAAAAAQVQPLARLVSQLDGRPQQADCNCPVQARWCAEMDAADYADNADYAGELVGAPRWMLLIALVNWLVRRRRCTTPCCRSWRVMMPASSILGPRTSRWRSPRVAKSL